YQSWSYIVRQCSICWCRSHIHPDDHLTIGPNCGVAGAPSGRVGGAGGCPAISAGIISAASVKRAVKSAPDDHLTACPNCSVLVAASRRIGSASCCPAVSGGLIWFASLPKGIGSIA